MTDKLDWTVIFREESPRLMRSLRRFRGRIVPEDIVQSAFAKMLERDVSALADPRAYLSRLARNLALDELRRQQRAGATPVSPETLEHLSVETAATPEESLIEAERFACIARVLRTLPAEERLAVTLFKLNGWSHETIGKRLGVSRHSVPRYLSRALARCANALETFENAGMTENTVSAPLHKRDWISTSDGTVCECSRPSSRARVQCGA